MIADKKEVIIMDLICPLCNGIENIEIECSYCSVKMKDMGPVVDYLDNYSPYLADDITQLVDGVSHDQCAHLFSCENCKYDTRIKINRVKM